MAQQAARLDELDGFTARQIELISLLAEGKSNKEIANELHIAYGTVKQHLVVLFRKLAVTSRSKAALVAQQLLREQGRNTKQPTAATVAADYKWRMLSAVAVTLPEPSIPSDSFVVSSSPASKIEHKQWLKTLHRFLSEHVEVLDGQLMVTTDHAFLACFGFPKAHTDDTDRALTIALAVRDFVRRHAAAYGPLKHMGIGVSNQTELVLSTEAALYGMDVFRHAVLLAQQSEKLGFSLMSRLSHRLSHMGLPTGQLRQGKSRADKNLGDLRDLSDALVILDHVDAVPEEQIGWGGLPFMTSVAQGVENGIAQWVSVSSWPVSSTASLMTAMLRHPALARFQCVHLRLPARKTRDVLLNRLMGQLGLLLTHPLKGHDRDATAGERLALQIKTLCAAGPLCLVVHGQQGFSTLRNALTDKGVEAIVSQPLLVIAEGVPTNQPEAVVQTLGPRATGLPFARSYVLPVPDASEFVSRLSMQAGALLDTLTPLARSILVDAAHQPAYDISQILKTLNEPVYVIQEALQELHASGLVVPSANESVAFRDPVLAEAICQMDVRLPDSHDPMDA